AGTRDDGQAQGPHPAPPHPLPLQANSAPAPTGQAAARADTRDGGQARRKLMRCKKVRLIINPRAGLNFTKITDVLAVFSAAGWKTDIAVKLHGGHAMELATEAVEDGYDLVIAYGGDGTINQVVNGIMAANSK